MLCTFPGPVRNSGVMKLFFHSFAEHNWCNEGKCQRHGTAEHDYAKGCSFFVLLILVWLWTRFSHSTGVWVFAMSVSCYLEGVKQFMGLNTSSLLPLAPLSCQTVYVQTKIMANMHNRPLSWYSCSAKV